MSTSPEDPFTPFHDRLAVVNNDQVRAMINYAPNHLSDLDPSRYLQPPSHLTVIRQSTIPQNYGLLGVWRWMEVEGEVTLRPAESLPDIWYPGNIIRVRVSSEDNYILNPVYASSVLTVDGQEEE